MARGGSSIFVSLVVAFLGLMLLIMAARAVLLLFLPFNAKQHNAFFDTLLEVSDPGRLAEFTDASRWYQVSAVLSTVLGIVVLSSLIAVMTTTLDRRMANLRKGHSRVVESGHTLILGWSSQRVVEVVRQLILANADKRDAAVVILADMDKEEMDDLLHHRLKDRKSTRIITRSGNPADVTKLDLVAVHDAKSAIVLSGVASTAPEELREAADAQVFKVLLALSAQSAGRTLNIVAEVLDPAFKAPARRIDPQHITPVCPAEIVAKILVETSRSVGLSAVYRALLSFEDKELYFTEGSWGGKTFGQVAFHFDDALPSGLRTADDRVVLNPDPGRILEPGEKLLVLATDDSTIRFSATPVVEPPEAPPRRRRRARAEEHLLLVGWTAKTARVVGEYAQYVLDGSTVDIMVAEPTEVMRAQAARLNGGRVAVDLVARDPAVPSTWDDTDLSRYDTVVILSADDHEHGDLVDARSIMILLLVQTALGEHHTSPTLITELVEADNEDLAREAGVHDFLVSPHFVSRLLAQVSEERALDAVFAELFAREGSELYLKPASLYFDELPVSRPFAELMARAQASGEVCLGVKLSGDEMDAARRYGVRLAPPKSATLDLTERDHLVILAEDET